jgi:hypothetical protein
MSILGRTSNFFSRSRIHQEIDAELQSMEVVWAEPPLMIRSAFEFRSKRINVGENVGIHLPP